MDTRLPAEERMSAALAAYPLPVRAVLLDVLTIGNDAERARRIGAFYADERSRGFAELLIDLEVEPAARAFVVGILLETSV